MSGILYRVLHLEAYIFQRIYPRCSYRYKCYRYLDRSWIRDLRDSQGGSLNLCFPLVLYVPVLFLKRSRYNSLALNLLCSWGRSTTVRQCPRRSEKVVVLVEAEGIGQWDSCLNAGNQSQILWKSRHLFDPFNWDYFNNLFSLKKGR